MRKDNGKDKIVLMDRREFVRRIGVGGLAVFPFVVPGRVLGSMAPSNRITLGCIGTGNMGTSNLKGFLEKPGAQILAVCDVEREAGERYGVGHKGQGVLGREPARRRVESCYAQQKSSGTYRGCDGYEDFRDLLGRKDIDVVVIATPDHWHVPMSLAAVRAGKDVYCEKPLTLTIGEGRLLADTVRQYGRILQTGSNWRSNINALHVCELVRNGRIGKLHTIRVKLSQNNVANPLDWHEEPVPDGFNYDLWLGPAPWEPYTRYRCHYSFRFLLDYSGGQVTNFGAHFLDIGQWGNGSDLSGPVEIEGRGVFPKDGLFTTAEEVDLVYTYANGVKMVASYDKTSSIRFEGSEGWVEVTWGRMVSEPASIVKDTIKVNEIHLYRSNDHHADFLNCVRARRRPAADVEIGHRSATVCHLGNIAMLRGKKLQWDPVEECFLNDETANRMTRRALRSPWRL